MLRNNFLELQNREVRFMKREFASKKMFFAFGMGLLTLGLSAAASVKGYKGGRTMKNWKKVTLIHICAVAAALFALGSRPAFGQTFCGSPTEVNLLQGASGEVVGTVTVQNTTTDLYVTYTMTEGNTIDNIAEALKLGIAVAAPTANSNGGIPTNNANNPKLGDFPFKQARDSETTGTFIISFGSITGLTAPYPGKILYIAAYASVNGSQAGWGAGTSFGSQNAKYFTYTIQECTTSSIEPGDFRTQTQGGWGTECSGSNPGCYRDDHFANAFPDGLVIGDADNGRSVTFTSSQAIQNFLPQGGTASSLSAADDGATNPTSTSAGVLGGQVVALTLSVGFDLDDPAFGLSATNLADLVVVKAGDACIGMTVQEVLDEANAVLAGLASSFTASTINGCVSKINENFVNGTFVGDYLGLP